jgi:type II secretory pathway pseudopilin PulG
LKHRSAIPSHYGFTLTELIILLVIVGLFLGMTFLRGAAQKDSAVANDVVMMQKDLTEAIREFKRQFHYLPGDLPNAANKIEKLPDLCRIPMITNNIGNGLIDTANEIQCVPEELKLAGFYNAHLAVDGCMYLLPTTAISSLCWQPVLPMYPILPQHLCYRRT